MLSYPNWGCPHNLFCNTNGIHFMFLKFPFNTSNQPLMALSLVAGGLMLSFLTYYIKPVIIRIFVQMSNSVLTLVDKIFFRVK